MADQISPHAEQIFKLLGRRTGEALCRSAGGSMLYVPMTLSRGTRAMKLLGPAGVAALQTRFAGREIRIPALAGLDRAARDDSIRKLRAQGIPAAEIASRAGLCLRQVREILRRQATEKPPEDFSTTGRPNDKHSNSLGEQ